MDARDLGGREHPLKMADLYLGWPQPNLSDVVPIDFSKLLDFTSPVDQLFGNGRGLPIDRIGIGGFVFRHKRLIRGQVLEAQRNVYAKLGDSAVEAVTILDIPEAANPDATMLKDLTHEKSLPTGAFDTIILTQVLQAISPFDAPTALDNMWNSLRPGGNVLLTMSSSARIDPGSPDHWRLTPDGMKDYLNRVLPNDAQISVQSWGNSLAMAAFSKSLAVEDLVQHAADLGVSNPLRAVVAQLNELDQNFPVLASACIHKSAAA